MRGQRLFTLTGFLLLGFFAWTFTAEVIPYAAVATGIGLYWAFGVLMARLKVPLWVETAAAAVFPFAVRMLFFGGLLLITQGEATRLDRLFPLFDRWALPAAVVGIFSWLGFFAERKRLEFFPWLALARISLTVALHLFPGWGPTAWWGHPLPALVVASLAVLWELMGLALWQRSRKVEMSHAWLLAFLPFLLLGAALSFDFYSKASSAAQAGLMQPTLFGFDFAPFISLESEIRLEKDLILVLRREGQAADQLLRRQVLSGYDQERGFFLDPSAPDPAERPLTLTEGTLVLAEPRGLLRREVKHDVFVVNIEPSGIVALNEPYRVSTLLGWDRTRFRGAYRVFSRVADEGAWTIASHPNEAGVDSETWSYYTRTAEDPKLEALALRIVEGYKDPTARTQRILHYLLDNYYYSLKPGVAVGQPPLHHFLFHSRKGYCSYFAFAMALMLRSLGIPSRVAVGFLADARSEVFGFYPVRSFQAHAWVEVLSVGQGWVPYDPTSTTLAPGEEWSFQTGADAAFLDMIESILVTSFEVSPGKTEILMPTGRVDGFRWQILALILLVAVIVVLLGYRLRFRWRLLFLKGAADQVIWRYWWGRKHLEVAGAPADPGLSPSVFSNRVQEAHWTILTDLYLRVQYAESTPADCNRRSRDCLRRLRQARPVRHWWRLLWI